MIKYEIRDLKKLIKSNGTNKNTVNSNNMVNSNNNVNVSVKNYIQNNLNEDARYFQRGCWNYQFDPEKMDEIRTDIHKFLRAADRKSRELITSLAEPESKKGQMTAGISMFYFEEATIN